MITKYPVTITTQTVERCCVVCVPEDIKRVMVLCESWKYIGEKKDSTTGFVELRFERSPKRLMQHSIAAENEVRNILEGRD